MKLQVTHIGEDYGEFQVSGAGFAEPLEYDTAYPELCEFIQKKGVLVSLDEIGLPPKTSIVQTKSKEYAAGASYIIDMVRAAYKKEAKL